MTYLIMKYGKNKNNPGLASGIENFCFEKIAKKCLHLHFGGL